MGADPAGQLLAPGGLGEGIAAEAQRGYEDRGLVNFAGVAVIDRNRRTGVIDEHLLARAVLLAKDQIQFFQPSPIQFAKPAVMCCNT